MWVDRPHLCSGNGPMPKNTGLLSLPPAFTPTKATDKLGNGSRLKARQKSRNSSVQPKPPTPGDGSEKPPTLVPCLAFSCANLGSMSGWQPAGPNLWVYHIDRNSGR